MAENIIFYGPPGTGKTFFMQKMMSDYIDYNIEDDTIAQFRKVAFACFNIASEWSFNGFCRNFPKS